MSGCHKSWIQSSLKTVFKEGSLNWKASKLTSRDCVGCICFPTYLLETALTPFSLVLLLKFGQDIRRAVQGGNKA